MAVRNLGHYTTHVEITAPLSECAALKRTAVKRIKREYAIWNTAIVKASLCRPGCKCCLIWENRGDRWRGGDNKVLAGRRLLRGFLLNYVMEHVRGLIAGLWSYATSHSMPQPPRCASPLQSINCQTSIKSSALKGGSELFIVMSL